MQKLKILIVEDDIFIAVDIKRALKKLNFSVTGILKKCCEIMDSIKQNEPNLIIMDINLKEKKDGIDIAKQIYQIKNIPILYLTSYNDEKTMQRAFETNPVGYLTKPFKIRELNSTIILATYKISKLEYKDINQDHQDIGFGYFFDLKNQKLYYYSRFIKLNPKEKKLLFILVCSNSLSVSKEKLEYELWSNNIPSSSALKTLVYRLKAKLSCNLIQSSSSGYKLVSINLQESKLS